MWPSKNILIQLFTVSILFGCQPGKPVDRSAIKEELESRELKHVTEGELMAKGEELGKAIVEKSQKVLQQSLKRALAEGGVSGAIQYCNLNAYSIVKDLEDSLGVTISRVTNQPRNPKNKLLDTDKPIWEAYEYTPENASSQIQVLDEQHLILTKPIKITTGLCLNCHGTVGETLTEENNALIQSLYPNDRATGYYTGDLRGMWRVVLPKKMVVKNL